MRHALADLAVFVRVSEERSFTRAARQLGLTSSALSHTMRSLEQRVGVRLLNRTTRSVAPTEAGARLLARLSPAFAEVEAAVGALDDHRDRPAGRVRISAYRDAATSLVAPRLARLSADYPEVAVELVVDDGMVDIIAGGFDAGVRPGELLAKDMVAVRIGPDQPSVVVGAPSYFARHPPVRSPDDLERHRCVAYRYSSGELHRWQFAMGRRTVKVAVDPCFIANDLSVLISAAIDGVGLAYVSETQVANELASGALVRVLERWSLPLSGAFLYYPGRRLLTPALRVVIDMFR